MAAGGGSGAAKRELEVVADVNEQSDPKRACLGDGAAHGETAAAQPQQTGHDQEQQQEKQGLQQKPGSAGDAGEDLDAAGADAGDGDDGADDVAADGASFPVEPVKLGYRIFRSGKDASDYISDILKHARPHEPLNEVHRAGEICCMHVYALIAPQPQVYVGTRLPTMNLPCTPRFSKPHAARCCGRHTPPLPPFVSPVRAAAVAGFAAKGPPTCRREGPSSKSSQASACAAAMSAALSVCVCCPVCLCLLSCLSVSAALSVCVCCPGHPPTASYAHAPLQP
jgi:hypothetical protein